MKLEDEKFKNNAMADGTQWGRYSENNVMAKFSIWPVTVDDMIYSNSAVNDA